MFRVITAVLFFSIFSSTVLAQTGNLEIKLLNGVKKEVDAGVNMNIIVMITNRADKYKEFQIRLKSKEDNLKLITDYSTIRIEKKSSINKILGIKIPNNFKAGDFTIVLEALENPGQIPFGVVEVPISVKPKFEIEVSKLNTPQYLFSGDTVNVSYLVQNLSNMDVTVKTTIAEGLKSSVDLVKIPRDSCVVSRYLVKIPKDLSVYLQQSVIMSALIVDKPETERSLYSSFEVFPTVTAKFDKFDRFPVKVAAIGVISNRLGKLMYSSMYDINGIGTIGKGKDSQLEFHLRGPDRTGNPLFGLNDEYYLKYKTHHFDLAVGDYNYGMSELTESSRGGRGIQLNYKLNKWTIGSYYNSPRYYPLVKQIYAAYSSYVFNPQNNISIGFVSKTDTSNTNVRLLSLAAVFKPFSWLGTDFELAVGENKSKVSKAYKAGLSLQTKLLSGNLNYLYADPEFPGFVSNSSRLFSGLSLKLKNVTFSLNYDLNSTNFALDTLYANMPYTENLNLSASFRLSQNSTITVGGYTVSLKDRSSKPLFDYSKTNGRMTVQSRIKSLSMTLLGDIGQMDNRLAIDGTEKSLVYNGTFALGYEFGRTFSTNIFTSYEGGKQKVTGNELFYYGCTLMANLPDRFNVSLQYNSDYQWRYYTNDRSLFSLSMNGRINDNNEISLGAEYNLKKNTLNNKEYNVQLRYTHKLNVPVSKKKDVGIATGKIINHGVESVSGIRLNLNGMITITDKEGNFKFPVVPIGTYMLGIDASSFGLNAIAETPGPYQIVITPGQVTHFELSVTKSARIAGHLVIQEDARTNQKGYIPIKEQIDKLIIEASNGTDVFRVFSDRDGAFHFQDLRPGSWTVKVYPNGLPQGYQIVTSQFNLNLTSGKQEKLDVIIQKIARQIKFQSTSK